MSNSEIGGRTKLAKNNPSGGGEAFLEKVYQELRRLAAARMSHESAPHTLQPTALVHEAWLRLGSGQNDWQNTAHFFSAAAQAMRRILIEKARKHSRLKRGAGQPCLNLDDLELAAASADDRILLIDEALQQLALIDSTNAEIVELKFFGGLTNQEIAEVLNVNERTIERKWSFAKAWLYSHLKSLNPRG